MQIGWPHISIVLILNWIGFLTARAQQVWVISELGHETQAQWLEHEVGADSHASWLNAQGIRTLNETSTSRAMTAQEAEACLQESFERVASGRRTAKRDVEECLRRMEASEQTLLADEKGRNALFDMCVLNVQVLLHTSSVDPQQLREQEIACQRHVPFKEPDPTLHPSDVLDALKETAQRQHEIHVQGHAPGCFLWVNGGQTRLTAAPTTVRLHAGEYRVHLECEGKGGPVHEVTLERGKALNFTQLEMQTVLKDGRIFLQAGQRPSRDALMRWHKEMADASGNTVLWVFAANKLYKIENKNGETKLDNKALPEGMTQPEFVAWLKAWQNEGHSSVDGEMVLKWTVGGVGLLSLASAWVMWGVRVEMNQSALVNGSPFSMSYDNGASFASYQNFAPMPLVFGITGSLTLSMSGLFLLPEEDEFPWWAWVSGMVGVALVGVTAGVLAGEGHCAGIHDGQYCYAPAYQDAWALSGMLLSTALPLFVVPFRYAF